MEVEMGFRNVGLFFGLFLQLVFFLAGNTSQVLAGPPKTLEYIELPLSVPAMIKAWHVSVSGNDSNPGTIELPFATIQHAIGAVC